MTNGYTTIQLDGETVGLKFAYPAIREFMEACLLRANIYFVQEEGGGFTAEGLAKLIQCSYNNNCLIKEVEPVLKYEAFYNYVEQAQETPEGIAELTRVTEVYGASTVMKKLIASNKEAADLEKKSMSL